MTAYISFAQLTNDEQDAILTRISDCFCGNYISVIPAPVLRAFSTFIIERERSVIKAAADLESRYHCKDCYKVEWMQRDILNLCSVEIVEVETK